MLNDCTKNGVTSVKNFKHPTIPNCMDWVKESWANIRADTITRTAPKVYMTPEPGPPIAGYEDNNENS